MSKQHTIAELTSAIHTAHNLRQSSSSLTNVVTDYAGLMKNGQTFPPVILGHYKGADGKRVNILVDGVLRVQAAKQAGLKTFAVEEIAYDSEMLALADRLKRNQGRGKDVTPGERNRWIIMLKQEGMSQVDIAKSVNLTEASVSRILKNKQGDPSPGGLKNKGRKHEGRAARGTATEEKVTAAIGTIGGFYQALKVIPLAIQGGAEKLLTAAEVQHVGIIENAMAALKGLHDDLVKHLHLAPVRKKAA